MFSRPGARFVGVLYFFFVAAAIAAQVLSSPALAGIVSIGDITDMVVDPDSPLVYVADKANNRVAVVDLDSESIVQTIPCGSSPIALALDAENGRLYVANRTAAHISIIDIVAGTVIDTISLGGECNYPIDIALGRPGRLYATGSRESGSAQWCKLHIVDTALRSDINSNAVSAMYNPALEISPDHCKLYIGERGLSPAGLLRADVSTDTITTVEVPFAAIGSNLQDMTVSPDGQRIYVACGWPYFVQTLETSTLTALGSFDTGPYPRAVAVSPDGSTLLASHGEKHVDVFSAASFVHRAVVATDPTEPEPAANLMRVSSDGSRLLVVGAAPYGPAEKLQIIPIPWPINLSISINAGATYTNPPTLHLAVAAENATEMSFFYPGVPEWTPWEGFDATKEVTVSAVDGPKRVWFRARNATATAPEIYDDILLDMTAPTDATIQINAGAEYTIQQTVNLALAAQDGTLGSGVGAMQFQYPGVVGWTGWEAYATSKQIGLPRHLGTATVSVRFRDLAGNISGTVSDSIYYTFEDVALTSPFFSHIQAIRKAGVTSGCSSSPPLYCPTAAVTRDQMAKFLCLAAGKTPLDGTTPTFADVPKSNIFYAYIERLADGPSWGGKPPTTGCMTVSEQKYFCPGDPATREQMAKFICRAAGKEPVSSPVGMFADVPLSNIFIGYIERLADPSSWPNSTAVTTGCSAGPPPRYCPADKVTRAQMAAFLARAFGLSA